MEQSGTPEYVESGRTSFQSIRRTFVTSLNERNSTSSLVPRSTFVTLYFEILLSRVNIARFDMKKVKNNSKLRAVTQ